MYSVFNPRGEKIADCGAHRDAVNLVNMRNCRWDGHFYQFKPIYETVDVEPFPQNQLPTRDIAVNMDGGVGGSWKEVSDEEFDELFDFSKQKQLPENQQQLLDL
jgi:hypothetical protein